MDVALKIWRYNAETGERELSDYEVEAPEWACLLDVLDIVKDKVDGTLVVPEELPDDDLRLVRHAHGRRARCSPARSRCCRSSRPGTCR